MALQEAVHAAGITSAPAAFRSDAERRHDRARGIDPAPVSFSVSVMDEPEIEPRLGRDRHALERREIRRVIAVLGGGRMQEITREWSGRGAGAGVVACGTGT